HPSRLLPLLAAHALLFHPPSTTRIYTLSLHDALPIYHPVRRHRDLRQRLRQEHEHAAASLRRHPRDADEPAAPGEDRRVRRARLDRKSTRLNSSHVKISYAVFCLKKKK